MLSNAFGGILVAKLQWILNSEEVLEDTGEVTGTVPQP